MKGKSILDFLAGTLVIGTLVIVILKVFEKKIVSHDEKIVNKTNSDNELLNHQKDTDFTSELLSDVKMEAINSIVERHESAAEIIKDSLQNIEDNTEGNRNNNEFDFLSNELKTLSK